MKDFILNKRRAVFVILLLLLLSIPLYIGINNWLKEDVEEDVESEAFETQGVSDGPEVTASIKFLKRELELAYSEVNPDNAFDFFSGVTSKVKFGDDTEAEVMIDNAWGGDNTIVNTNEEFVISPLPDGGDLLINPEDIDFEDEIKIIAKVDEIETTATIKYNVVFLGAYKYKSPYDGSSYSPPKKAILPLDEMKETASVTKSRIKDGAGTDEGYRLVDPPPGETGYFTYYYPPEDKTYHYGWDTMDLYDNFYDFITSGYL